MKPIERFILICAIFFIVLSVEQIILTPNPFNSDNNYTNEALFSQIIMWVSVSFLVYVGCKPLLKIKTKDLNT